ncbi:TrlF family AAA-like ATPase [Corynebacterium lujinxingii]
MRVARASSVGAVWRKWDLHVHVPNTRMNNQFDKVNGHTDWDRFCKILQESDVEVFGITDYFSLDSFFEFKRHFEKLYPDSNKVFFPNLELRLDVAVHHSDSNINAHLIFPPDITQETVDLLLSHIPTSSQSGEGTRSKLLSEHKNSSEKVLKGVTVNFEQCLHAIQETLDDVKTGEYDSKVMIAFSGNKDGLSPGDFNDRKGQLIDNYDLHGHVIFSNSTNAPHWLDTSRGEGTGRNIKPHPTFYGSDAHSFEGLEKMLGKNGEDDDRRWETTWVKAEPTWEGFRQTLAEPADRVRIQPTIPDAKNDYLIIESIEFSSPELFPDKINLNPNLNAIIGSRSSGKSSLLAHIAHSVRPDETEAQQKLAGMDKPGPAAGFVWETNNSQLCKVNWRDDNSGQGNIVYVPQNFLNSLSDNADEVTKRIRPAVRSANEELMKTFDSRVEERDSISRLIEELVQLWFQKSQELGTSQKELGDFADRDALRAQHEKLKSDMAAMSVSANLNDKELEHVAAVKETLGRKRISIENLKSRAASIRECLTSTANTGTGSQTDDLVGVSLGIGTMRAELSADQLEEIEDWRAEKQRELNSEFRMKMDALAESTESTLASSNEEVARVQRDNKDLFERFEKNAALVDLQKRISKIELDLDNLENKARRVADLTEEMRSLEREIDAKIDERSAKESLLEKEFNSGVIPFADGLIFKVEISFSPDQVNKCSAGFNARSKSDFITEDRCLDIRSAQANVATFLHEVSTGSLKVKKEYEPESLARMILSARPEIRFAAEMDGDTIGGFGSSTMTPGKQALFALTLILSDVGEDWPLLIDQPEDDLDSKSIYESVVQFLRRQKQRRQILMVTHNANLVVGADAELVIVANRHGVDRPNEDDRVFDYASGPLESIENVGSTGFELDRLSTRDHVVEILDGGEEAFRKRQQRYQLPAV